MNPAKDPLLPYVRGSVPAPRPSEPLPCPFCGSKAVTNTTGAGCTNTECDAHLANVYLRTWNRRSPSVPTATQEQREAFLLAANVASIIRDEYETLAKQEGVSRQQRERFNRDATVARQVKGQILAYAGIQEWPAPKPSSPPVSSSEEAANSDTPQKLHGVVWALIGDSDGRVVLERCEKKARVLGVGEWFLPGGKIEGDETPEECLRREIGEEWPGVELLTARPLPIVEGSSVPPGPRGLFLMRPFVVTVRGEVPSHSSEGTPLRWASVAEALFSPVPQVRMIVAAARVQGENSQ